MDEKEVLKLFDFLINNKNIEYGFQEFTNCYNGGWDVKTYSFYNSTGCFTIVDVVQRDVEFYFSKKYGNTLEILCEKDVDVCSIESETWRKHQKIGPFKNMFFWCSKKRIINALAGVIRVHLTKSTTFFGICTNTVGNTGDGSLCGQF